MKSFGSILLALSLASVAVADYYIDPDSVSESTRDSWCSSELSTCPLICQQIPPGTTLVNTCDPSTLTYGCLCGNNQQPNVSEYTLTLPYFVCTQWGTNCVANCGSDSACASDCRQNHPCGALHPAKPNTTTSSATMSATASATSNQVFGGFGATSSPSSNALSFAPATLEVGSAYSLALMVGTLFTGFAVLL